MQPHHPPVTSPSTLPLVSTPTTGANDRGVKIGSPTTIGTDKSEEFATPKQDVLSGTPPTSLKSSKKEAPPAKRLWNHFDEQPGRLMVDGVTGENTSVVIDLAPRQELTAHWSLPISYLQQCLGKDFSNMSLQQALKGLTVGLFRRGCTENGGQASIISKLVIDNRSYEYGHDPATRSVRGKVPFFSPRTPGYVLFRLYWDHESLYTLAMGPTLHVRVSERDFDSSIRFILSNFKGKKSNPTSLSSLNSLAQVLETPVRAPNESAARAVWGSIQEARKVVEACAQEYVKTSNRLSQLEETVEELKQQVEEERVEEGAKSNDSPVPLEGTDPTIENDNHDDGLAEEVSEAASALREKTRSLMTGRASCERKWRDSQLSFASILKAAVMNPSLATLLRRDMVLKMRLEYQLWCPLSEEFAVLDDSDQMWFVPLREKLNNMTSEDFQLFADARTRMQMRTLGFVPNVLPLEDILFPRSRAGGAPNTRSMDPGAVSIFNNLSAAMGQYYQELHTNEDVVVRKRELIRERTEKCVQECGAFPPGTTVVIFGSAANGFGSPRSDIDMCLQLPNNMNLDGDDTSGAEAMAKLAACFEGSGMQDVDTARLTGKSQYSAAVGIDESIHCLFC